MESWEWEVMVRAAGWIGVIQGVSGLLFIFVLDKLRLSLGGMTPNFGDLVLSIAPTALVVSGLLIHRRKRIARRLFVLSTLPWLVEVGTYSFARGPLIHGSVFATTLVWLAPSLFLLPTLFSVYALQGKIGHAVLEAGDTRDPLAPLWSVIGTTRSIRGWCACSFVALALASSGLMIGLLA